MNKVLGTQCADVDALHLYMKANKTECALKIFSSAEPVKLPDYILEAVQ